MTTAATIKGGAVSSLSTTGGLFTFVNSKEVAEQTGLFSFVNATKDQGERKSL